MRKAIRTRPVSGAQVRAYAGKAEEYADAAASEIDAGRPRRDYPLASGPSASHTSAPLCQEVGSGWAYEDVCWRVPSA